jgi:hypothetical protein
VNRHQQHALHALGSCVEPCPVVLPMLYQPTHPSNNDDDPPDDDVKDRLDVSPGNPAQQSSRGRSDSSLRQTNEWAGSARFTRLSGSRRLTLPATRMSPWRRSESECALDGCAQHYATSTKTIAADDAVPQPRGRACARGSRAAGGAAASCRLGVCPVRELVVKTVVVPSARRHYRNPVGVSHVSTATGHW